MRRLDRTLRRGSPAPVSLTSRALSAIRRNGGTLLLPGAATPVLGEELVANGTFDSDTGWTPSFGTATYSDGKLRVTSIGHVSAPRAHQNFTTIPGATYILSAGLNATTSQAVAYVGLSGGFTTSQIIPPVTPTGTATALGTFTATGTTTSVILLASSTTSGNFAEFDNISVREILSYTHGNPPLRNYLDSAGTDILDSVTQVDQPVGLALDSMGVLGPERLQDFVTGVGGTATAATYDPVTGIGTATRVDLSNQSFVRITGLTAAKSYRLTITNTGAVTLNVRQLDYAGSTVTTVAAGTSGECVFTGNATCVITAAGGNCAFTLTSFKEIPGNHATQPTTASKPILRRGLVNQLLWSGGFTNAAWLKLNATVTASAAVAPDGTLTACRVISTAASGEHYVEQVVANNVNGQYTQTYHVKADASVPFMAFAPVMVGGPYTVATLILRNTAGVLAYETATPGIDSYTIEADANGWYRVTLRYTLSGTVTSHRVRIYSLSGAASTGAQIGDGTSGILLHRAALFQGTVTADQILAAGGIPLTTTAPASSERGRYSWEFDGSTTPADFLQTGITTGNEGWVCAGVTPANTTTAMSVVNAGEGTPTVPGVWLFSSTAGNWTVSAADGSFRTQRASPVLGTAPQVVSIGWNASSLTVGVNNTETTSAKIGSGSWSSGANTLRIGAYQGSSEPLKGQMSATVYTPVLPSAADRALIRRFVGSLQGQQL